MRMESRMKIELQLGGRFGACRCVLPVLQRFFDGIHKHRMTADDFSGSDLSVWGDDDLQFHDTYEAEFPSHFGISGCGT